MLIPDLVLNPNIKDVYFRTQWGSEEYKKGMAALEKEVSPTVVISELSSLMDFSSINITPLLRLRLGLWLLPQHCRSRACPPQPIQELVLTGCCSIRPAGRARSGAAT
jgi:hypothetical protein